MTRAPRCCCASTFAPGGSTSRELTIAPLVNDSPHSMCRAGSEKDTAHTTPCSVSTTGVLVIPDGSMLPHGSADPGTGVARCRTHRSVPVAALKAYTVLFSVATMTVVPATRGWAYTAPSSAGVVQARPTLPAGGD